MKINLGAFVTDKGPCKCGHPLTPHLIYGDGKCWMIIGYKDNGKDKFKIQDNSIRCWCDKYDEANREERGRDEEE